MGKMLWVIGALLTVIPCVIAYKRKCANFVLIDLLSVFLSWTIIGWVIAMAWAIWGRSDPRELSRQTGGL
jgi:Superinfection immunity protein